MKKESTVEFMAQYWRVVQGEYLKVLTIYKRFNATHAIRDVTNWARDHKPPVAARTEVTLIARKKK